jgi:4-hydroxy-tetrahydrodipicolinate synthase
MARFGRVITAMVTPFSSSGELDLGAAQTLAQYLEQTGSEGLVVGGTTGESPTLSDSELMALARTVKEAVRIPVTVGTGTNDTRHAVELTKRVVDTGADAILSVVPYYNRPGQAGLIAHFTAIDGAPLAAVQRRRARQKRREHRRPQGCGR